MPGLNPRNAVRDYQPIGNGYIKIAGAKPLVPDIETAGVKGEYRKKNPVDARNSKCFWPVLPGEAFSRARVVQPVKADIEMIEQRRANGFVPSKTEVVREARLEKVLVEGRRYGLGSVKLFLVPAAPAQQAPIAPNSIRVTPENRGGLHHG